MVYPHVQYQGPAHPDRDTADRPSTARELDSRASDGIQVRLLWHPHDGHTSVVVNDLKTGEMFEVRVRDGDRAADVFHHPYAYAGGRSQRTGRAARAAAPATSPA